MLAGRVSPLASTPGAAQVPSGSMASWISRATSRSRFNDNRSKTSSSTSRFITANAKMSQLVPGANDSVGTPTRKKNGGMMMGTPNTPMPRKSSSTPIAAATSASP